MTKIARIELIVVVACAILMGVLWGSVTSHADAAADTRIGITARYQLRAGTGPARVVTKCRWSEDMVLVVKNWERDHNGQLRVAFECGEW